MGILQSVMPYASTEGDEQVSNGEKPDRNNTLASPHQLHNEKYLTIAVPNLRNSSSLAHTIVNISSPSFRQKTPQNVGRGKKQREEAIRCTLAIAAALAAAEGHGEKENQHEEEAVTINRTLAIAAASASAEGRGEKENQHEEAAVAINRTLVIAPRRLRQRARGKRKEKENQHEEAAVTINRTLANAAASAAAEGRGEKENQHKEEAVTINRTLAIAPRRLRRRAGGERKISTKEKENQHEESAVTINRILAIAAASAALEGRWIKHYCSLHRILLVGEGDFSFAACLAAAFGSATNMVATSLDSEDFLVKNYCNALSNIAELSIRKCMVMHEIDATKMANHPILKQMKFDRIVFNFPSAGVFKDIPRDSQLRLHRRLVSRFLMNAKEMVSENGEIHLTHMTNGFNMEWMIESIASSHKLRLIDAVDFDHEEYAGYNKKRGFGGDNSFNCYPSKTYKFMVKEREEEKKVKIKTITVVSEERWIKHYSSRHRILLVGEGDFSFAACLARVFSSAYNIVATSLDSEEMLGIKHPTAAANLGLLKQKGCTVIHGVDARTMSEHHLLRRGKFHRIVFNFPHAGFRALEHDSYQISLHQDVVRGFLKNAREMVAKKKGEVHVSHKAAHPYSEWKIEKLGEEVGLVLTEKADFDISDYPGYENKRGDGQRSNDSFPLGTCYTYKMAKII